MNRSYHPTPEYLIRIEMGEDIGNGEKAKGEREVFRIFSPVSLIIS